MPIGTCTARSTNSLVTTLPECQSAARNVLYPHRKDCENVRQHEEDERVQMAPNMEAGYSHPQTMADAEEEERQRTQGQQKEEMLRLLREWRSEEWWSEPSSIS